MSQSLPDHVEWLAVHRAHALRAVLAAQGGPRDIRQALAIMVEADPDPGNHGVQWLCDTLLAGGYLWEDVAAGAGSKASQTLALFGQHRAALPRSARNLASYPSLGDVWATIEPLVAQPDSEPVSPAGRELRRAQRAQAYRESVVVWQAPDVMLVSPTTLHASQWWGRGTRWCTTEQNGIFFNRYNKEACLLIVVMPLLQSAGEQGGGKLQLQINSDGEIHFMDAQDRQVKSEFVDLHWSTLEPLISWMLARSWQAIAYVPQARQTPQMCADALKNSPMYLKYINPDLLDQEQVLAVLRKSRQSLVNVAPSLRTPSVCRLAVERMPSNLRYVSHEVQTTQMCLTALARNKANFEYVAPALQTRAMCLAAVKANGRLLQWARPDLQDIGLCMRALRENGQALQWVQPHLRTIEMYRQAVKGAPGMLVHVPAQFRDQDMCLRAVRRSGNLQWVPQAYRTRKLCMSAVARDGMDLQWVACAMQDAEMCLVAVKCSGMALAHVRSDLRTRQVCTAAVLNSASALEFCPPNADHDSVVMAMLENNGAVLSLIAESERTPAMYMAAVKSNPHALKKVSAHLQTPQMCTAAVGAHAMSLAHVAAHLQTAQMCALALSHQHIHMPSLLSVVRPDLRTLDFYRLVVQRDADMLSQVPSEFRDAVKPPQGWARVAATPGLQAKFNTMVEVAARSAGRAVKSGLGSLLIRARQTCLDSRHPDGETPGIRRAQKEFGGLKAILEGVASPSGTP